MWISLSVVGFLCMAVYGSVVGMYGVAALSFFVAVFNVWADSKMARAARARLLDPCSAKSIEIPTHDACIMHECECSRTDH